MDALLFDQEEENRKLQLDRKRDIQLQICITPVELRTKPVDGEARTQFPKLLVDLEEHRIYDLPWIITGIFFMFSGSLVAGLSKSVCSYLEGWLGLMYLCIFGVLGLAIASTGAFILLSRSLSYKWLHRSFDFTILHKLGLWRKFNYYILPNATISVKLGNFVPKEVNSTFILQDPRIILYPASNLMWRLYNLLKPKDRRVSESVSVIRSVTCPEAMKRSLPYDLLCNGVEDPKKVNYTNLDAMLALHEKFDASGKLVFCEALIVDQEVLSDVFSPTYTGPKFTKEDRELRVRALLSGKIDHIRTGSHLFVNGVDVYHDSMKFYNLVAHKIQTAPAPSNLN